MAAASSMSPSPKAPNFAAVGQAQVVRWWQLRNFFLVRSRRGASEGARDRYPVSSGTILMVTGWAVLFRCLALLDHDWMQR